MAAVSPRDLQTASFLSPTILICLVPPVMDQQQKIFKQASSLVHWQTSGKHKAMPSSPSFVVHHCDANVTSRLSFEFVIRGIVYGSHDNGPLCLNDKRFRRTPHKVLARDFARGSFFCACCKRTKAAALIGIYYFALFCWRLASY